MSEEQRYWREYDFIYELLKKLPTRVFWKNTEGIYLGCNDAFARSVRFNSPEEIIGKTDYDFPVSREDSDLYREDDRQVMASREPKLNIEEIQTFSDGSVIHLLTSKVPLFNRDGNIMGVLGIYSDITELKTAQNNAELQRQKAEAASKAKSEFIANMSHDIRTPITGLIGMIQDLLNTADNVQSRFNTGVLTNTPVEQLIDMLNYLERKIRTNSNIVLSGLDKLLKIYNEIIEVVSLDSGRMVEKAESFDLKYLLKSNVELLQPLSINKNINLLVDISENTPPYAHGLSIYLSRSILNLLSNAIKFTESGYVKLQVRSDADHYRTGDTINITIIVEDTGPGIPKDKQKDIFEQFTRLSPSYDGVHEGFGLGLYTVKRYIDAMHGTIKVNSDGKSGSQFIITTPLVVSDHSDRIVESPQLKPISDQKLEIKKILESYNQTDKGLTKVLIVEDNYAAAMSISILLNQSDCQIDIADNGELALKRVNENDYQIIFMDVGLPGLNGMDVTKKIRQHVNPQKSTIPIIALTGHANDKVIRDQCLSAQMNAVMEKPATAEKLHKALKQFVNQDKSQAIYNTKIIDWEACLKLCNNNPELTREMLSILARELEATHAVLSTAFAEFDINTMRAEQHRCMAGVRYLVAPNIEMALQQFSDALKSSPTNHDAIRDTYHAVQHAIDEYLTFHEQIK